MKIAEITNDFDLLKYRDGGELRFGVKYPLEYLKQGKVFGAFKDGELVGGFNLILNGPFRTVHFLPDEVRRNAPILSSVAEENLVELGGVWLCGKAVNQTKDSNLFWMSVIRSIVRCGKPYVIYGYNKQTPNLEKVYDKFNGVKIYVGPGANSPDSPRNDSNHYTHKAAIVAIVPTSRIWFGLLKLFAMRFRSKERGISRRLHAEPS